MKAKILELLRKKGTYVSGQELCEQFGVSRTAVWKAIGQLKKEGYEIEALQNKGYRLCESKKEVFGQHELVSRMETKWTGKPLYFYDQIDSTNAKAKSEAEAGAPHGSLYVADMQTAGRGRRGRAWDSPAGTNLYFTLLLRPVLSPDKAGMLTLVMALAVAKGIQKSLAETCSVGIKWPNDIVVNGKKVCGILTEMSMSVEQRSIQYVVIGVGINVGKQSFPEEIKAIATNLEEASRKPVMRSSLLFRIMEAFEDLYDAFMEKSDLSGMQEVYNRLLVNKDRQVRVLDPKGEFEAVATGINEKGELLVTLPDGSIKEIYAGEVSVRGIYGYV